MILIRAEAIFASSISKFGKSFPQTYREDFNSSKESTQSWCSQTSIVVRNTLGKQSLQHTNRFQYEFCDPFPATALLQSPMRSNRRLPFRCILRSFDLQSFATCDLSCHTCSICLRTFPCCSSRCFRLSWNISTFHCRCPFASCENRKLGDLSSRNTNSQLLSPVSCQNLWKHLWILS